MKKFFISAIVALGFCAAANADEVNFVVNGDFEDPNFVQATPEGWNWDGAPTDPDASVLPGWTTRTGGIWNGVIGLLENVGDGDIRPEEDKYICHFYNYYDNGWTNLSISQVLTGLVAGEEYTLSYYFAYTHTEGANWTPDPSYGFAVAEPEEKTNTWIDEDGVEQSETYIGAGKEIVSKDIAKEPDFSEIYYSDFEYPVEQKFTATSDKAYLEIYMGTGYYEGNTHTNWMDIDMVKVTGEAGEGGVYNVKAAADQSVEYYNLQGVRVANPENGLYIRRQGNTVTKVIR